MPAAVNTTHSTAAPAACATDNAPGQARELGGPDTVTSTHTDRTRALPAGEGGERRAHGRVLHAAQPRIVAYDTDFALPTTGRMGGWFTNHIDALIHAQLIGTDTAILRHHDGRHWLAPLSSVDPSEVIA